MPHRLAYLSPPTFIRKFAEGEIMTLRVLVACEYSGRVRDAFRAKGHDAWSCDLLDPEISPSGLGHLYHLKGDVRRVLDGTSLRIWLPLASGDQLHWRYSGTS